MCVKSGAARFPIYETIKFHPIPLYGRRATRPPLSPPGAPVGPLCTVGPGYVPTTGRVWYGSAAALPGEVVRGCCRGGNAGFPMQKSDDFCTKIACFRSFFARNCTFFAHFRRPIPAYPDVSDRVAPGHSIRSRCIFYRRRYCRPVCGQCGGPYPSVWPTSRKIRHAQGLAARAARLNGSGVDAIGRRAWPLSLLLVGCLVCCGIVDIWAGYR